jgi:hypothetical protein
MKMIPHQTQRLHLPARLDAHLPERFQKPLPGIPLVTSVPCRAE